MARLAGLTAGQQLLSQWSGSSLSWAGRGSADRCYLLSTSDVNNWNDLTLSGPTIFPLSIRIGKMAPDF